MTDDLRVGVIGTGSLGTHLCGLLEGTGGGHVAAIADVSDENRRAAGERFGVAPDARYGDYEAMLDGEALDAVFVATPHTLHYEQTVACLERGLHVLCEKPLTTDLAQARDLVARDEAGDATLMVGYQRHVAGPYVTARERLRSFDADPSFVTASITQDWIAAQRDAWRSDPALSGGGQLYDTGSHVVDAVLWATGLTPTAVSASMVFWDEDERVDTQATLDVEFAEDAVASIAVSGDAPQVREHHRYWTDDGGVYLDGRGWNERSVHVVDADGAERHPRVDAPYADKVAAFLASIREGTDPPATARHALAVTAVTEAAYESARTGERVDVDLDDV